MMTPTAHKQLRIGGRFLQFVFALVALALVAAGFKKLDGGSFGLKTMLGSHATNYAMIITYTAMIYALVMIITVEHLGVTRRPKPFVEMAIDGLMAVLLLVAGIVLATDDYVKDCDSYGIYLRCNNLKTGMAFTFVTMAMFLISMVIAFITRHDAVEDTKLPRGTHPADLEAPYHTATTPVAANPIHGHHPHHGHHAEPAALSPMGPSPATGARI